MSKMTVEQMQQRLQEIGTCEDDVQRRTLIANFSEDAAADYEEHATVLAERDQFAADNEDLRKANMDLFKKIGVRQEQTLETGNEPKAKRKFEDLFDDKGGIK